MVTQEYTYAYAAVSVSDGQLDTLILPHANGQCMQLFLDEVASRHPHERIVMVLDGAGWHQSESLSLATNLRLLKLPPYAPELNPVEHLWDDLREKSFHNRVFDSMTPSKTIWRPFSSRWSLTISASIRSSPGHGLLIH